MNFPKVDWSQSTETSLKIVWDELIDLDSNINGYSLEMYYSSEYTSGEFVEIYNGRYNKEQLAFTVKGLTTGVYYQFRLRAINYNGYGVYSDIKEFYACSSPSQFAKPWIISQSETQILI